LVINVMRYGGHAFSEPRGKGVFDVWVAIPGGR
jgi:hypothetical protein